MPKQIVVDGVLVDVEDNDDNSFVDNSDLDPNIDDPSGGDDGGDDIKDPEKVVEPWMDDGSNALPDVPVSTHIKVKQKLKGKLSDKNEELELLKQENEALKQGTFSPKLKELPKRPNENDFDTIQEFENALVTYDQEMVDVRVQTANKRVEIQRVHAGAKAKLEENVDDHYTRAAKLIADNGIDTEVYKAADTIVRESIEAILPGKGDLVTDQMISIIGKGSEKVIFFLGRNKNALNEFKTLLIEDPTGLQTTLFLGRQKERFINSKRKTSNAPAPSSEVHGDDSVPVKGKDLLRKRKAALKKGNVQLAYSLKKQARVAGVDVTNW